MPNIRDRQPQLPLEFYPRNLRLVTMRSKAKTESQSCVAHKLQSQILLISEIGDFYMNYDMKGSGLRIQWLRNQHGYTQERLANELSIDRSLLSYIEAGKKGCSVDLLIQFSEFFNVSLDYLILGVVHFTPAKADAKEHMGRKIDELICQLETFKQALEMRCDK